ncbi:MAG: pyrroline-5-carboxylate reductase [Clostridia bacterium]|nr:pyrroline-5-carboxylate reductase [Clostridia bacterium]
MKKQFKLGVVSCDFWSQSILKGVVLSEFLHEKKILVSDSSEDKLEEVKYLGVRTTTDNSLVAQNCEFVIISGNPQNFDNIVKSFNGTKPEKLISVIPNLKKNTIKNSFGTGAIKVARCLLNLPCAIGSGTIGIDMTDFNKVTDDTEFISNIFNCIGSVLSVDESKMDAVSGLSGNGAAYVFMFLDALIDGGVQNGLTKNEAKVLAVQTLLGSAEMVEQGDQTLSELTMQACKGGAVMDALKVLEEYNFRKTVTDAVTACVKRTKELSDK